MIKVFNTGLKVARGEIHIIEDRCKGCGFCITHCPMDVLELSDEFNINGYHTPRVKDIENCINCGLCEILCPEFAIWSILKEEKEVLEVAV